MDKEVLMKQKEEITKQLELINQFEKDQQRIKNYGNSGLAIESVSVGKYRLVRMYGADDIYNNAMYELDIHYLVDKEGIPHQICEINAGNANSNATPIAEIDKTEKLLNDIVYAVAVSESKSPLKLLDKQNIQSIVSQLEECIEKNDFSTLDIDKLKSNTSQKILKSFEDKQKDKLEFFQRTNYHLTREQAERNDKRYLEERGS